MKTAVLFLFAFVSYSRALLEGSFLVPVDHFRFQDGRTTRFNYVVNLDHYIENGPLMFYIDDTSAYSNYEFVQSGLIVDLAMELGAALFTTDIRYFGQNVPTQTATLEDLSYLSIEQILADIPFFIQSARQYLNNYVGQVFLWGGGVGGKWSVLARQKYPNLIDGVWCSGGVFSADVFTTSPYATLASNIGEVGGAECAERVTQAFRQVNELIAQQDDETLVQEFGICRPFDVQNSMDIALFSDGLINRISSYIDRNHHSGVASFCNAMSVIPSDPMRSFSRWIRFVNNVDTGACSNYDYATYIQSYQDTNWNSPGTSAGRRQRLYISCTQFGNLRTTTSTGMFGNRVTEEFNQRRCQDAFGPDFNFDQLYLNLEYIRTLYGGLNPRVTHAIFSNGYLDFWIGYAITNTTEHEAFAINVPGYSRWADLTSISPLDSIVLHTAKNSVIDTFRNWYNNQTSNII